MLGYFLFDQTDSSSIDVEKKNFESRWFALLDFNAMTGLLRFT